MDHFRHVREARIEGYVFETNKLLIRLDKLLRNYPDLNDMVARREHEQSIVEWVQDDFVNLCPSCASRFNFLTRKKHHCRLCGAVMCTKCSEFIDFEFAYELIAPIDINSSKLPSSYQMKIPTRRNSLSLSSTNLANLTKTGSNILQMVASPITSENNENIDKIRLCGNCYHLLIARKEKLEVAHCKPAIVQLYDQLRVNVDEVNKLLQIFYKMSESL